MKITKENEQFLDELFANLMANQDTDMMDLHDSDACDEHFQLEKNEEPAN